VAAQADRGRPAPVRALSRPPRSRWRRLIAGGTAGNEQLTALTGVMLLVGLAVLGVTILRIGQLLNAHMFVGLLLIGPVALKIASTGYRFARYNTADPRYRAKGPPGIELRMIAPIVVLSTVVVFGSGVVLLFGGPAVRTPWILIHKASFFVWAAFTALHVLGHIVELPRAPMADRRATRDFDDYGSGRGARVLSLTGALVGGLVLALVLEYQFVVWAGYHHHH
jgi:hypothetical protein